MTNEEARHICKLALNCFAMKRESYLPIETQEKAISWIAEQADIRTMLEALEKQIPEKPNKATIKMLSDEVVSSYFICPICNTPLMVGYPCKCGQMIDWSEDDD